MSLPVLATVAEALRPPPGQGNLLLALATPVLLLHILLTGLEVAYGGAVPGPLVLITWLASLWLNATWTVNLTRLVLLGPGAIGGVGSVVRFGATELRFLGTLLLIALPQLPLVILALTAIGIDLLISQNALSGAQPTGQPSAPVLLVLLGCSVVALYLWGRLMLALPAVAMGEARPVATAWERSRPVAWRLVAVHILCAVPVVLPLGMLLVALTDLTAEAEPPSARHVLVIGLLIGAASTYLGMILSRAYAICLRHLAGTRT